MEGEAVRRTLLSLVTALMLSLGVMGGANAVTNGQPDGDDHPYVGLIVFDTQPGVPGRVCSGSLIGPTVVLTAAHCTEGAVAARVWFQADVTSSAVPFPLYPYGGPGSGAIEGSAQTNPYFNVDNPYGGGNGLPAFMYRDVGVVVLDEPVTDKGYAELPEAGLNDTLRSGTAVDYVGYGVQEQVMSEPGESPYDRWTGARVRMFATGVTVSGKFKSSPDLLRLSQNPGRGMGGTCLGDSGGPDFLAGTSTVLAVNSYVTNANCAGVGYSARVDVPEILEWVGGFLG